MVKRSVSKRLRFEILKRDGFACRYCGALSTVEPLHVDHVKPLAEGGTNDPANLVTSCASCNGGKGAVPLDESRIGTQRTAEELREQAAQIREYTEAALELQDAQESLYERLADIWRQEVGRDPLVTWYKQLPRIAQTTPLPVVVDAIKAAGARSSRGYISDVNLAKYFGGCLRNATGAQ